MVRGGSGNVGEAGGRIMKGTGEFERGIIRGFLTVVVRCEWGRNGSSGGQRLGRAESGFWQASGKCKMEKRNGLDYTGIVVDKKQECELGEQMRAWEETNVKD
ncbi:unnamed protein product [Calypogeia fissa]